MDSEGRTRHTFLLRLPNTTLQSAKKVAQSEGISLNHFISLAVAEKLSRLEEQTMRELAGLPGKVSETQPTSVPEAIRTRYKS
jgi:hypothetical protein